MNQPDKYIDSQIVMTDETDGVLGRIKSRLSRRHKKDVEADDFQYVPHRSPAREPPPLPPRGVFLPYPR